MYQVPRLVARWWAVLMLIGVFLSAGCHRTAPSPPPPTAAQTAKVRDHYVRLFGGAQTITISSAWGKVPPKTLRRRDHADFFTRLEAAMRAGDVKRARCQCGKGWYLDVVNSRGATTRVDTRHYLMAEGQPDLQSLHFYPALPAEPGQEADLGLELHRVMGRGPTGLPYPGPRSGHR